MTLYEAYNTNPCDDGPGHWIVLGPHGRKIVDLGDGWRAKGRAEETAALLTDAYEMGLTDRQTQQAIKEEVTSAIGLRRIAKNND